MATAERLVALLDVNVLVALFDAEHVHHELAHDWFETQRPHGWATCPLTENGFVRILSNPAYGFQSLRADAVAERLRKFRASGHHAFWSDTVSLVDERLFDLSVVRGYRQLTDVYLLGVARKMNGCLASFDTTIPWKAVVGATPKVLQTLGSAD